MGSRKDAKSQRRTPFLTTAASADGVVLSADTQGSVHAKAKSQRRTLEFVGSRWNRVKAVERRQYLKNAYRVLMTRGRQGMIIAVPLGDPSDITRQPEFYDRTYSFLKAIGINELKEQ